MKRILIFVILVLTVVLSGCSKTGDSADDTEARKLCNFKKVYADVNVGIYEGGIIYDIYVDTTTGVLYLKGWRGFFTPLYNADGTLKIWDYYKEAT